MGKIVAVKIRGSENSLKLGWTITFDDGVQRKITGFKWRNEELLDILFEGGYVRSVPYHAINYWDAQETEKEDGI